MRTNINRPTAMPLQTEYFAAVVEASFGCRCISLRGSPEEALACDLVGKNPRIIRVPREHTGSSAALCAFIEDADRSGTSVRISP